VVGGQMLVAKVGGIDCAIPIAHVVETMRPLPIEPVAEAGTLGFIRGMSIVRGEAILVVDAAQLLGQVAREQARFVVIRAGERIVAMLVDAVIGVRSLDAAVFSELPPLVQAITRDNVTAIGALDRELFVVLDTGRILP
jgi:purine-binding chemotaxis protein CheW